MQIKLKFIIVLTLTLLLTVYQENEVNSLQSEPAAMTATIETEAYEDEFMVKTQTAYFISWTGTPVDCPVYGLCYMETNGIDFCQEINYPNPYISLPSPIDYFYYWDDDLGLSVPYTELSPDVYFHQDFVCCNGKAYIVTYTINTSTNTITIDTARNPVADSDCE